MFYNKTERYGFSCPREYKAYSAFRDRLKSMGITFTEEGGVAMQYIIVRTNGDFEVDDDGEIQFLKD